MTGAPPSEQQLQQIEAAIAGVEALRGTVGDAVVEAALAPLRAQLVAVRARRVGGRGARAVARPRGAGARRSAGAPATAAAETTVPEAAPPEAERRQLTVMFCDLVGSTAMAERLDPEDLREVVRAYQHVCAEVIERFEGSIAQYLGDGLLVYFGYPLAHEDDAERAVRAALAAVAEVRRLDSRLHGVRLAVRVGIHTGQVVIGEVGGGRKREDLALGDTPNVAARVQGLARPGTVVISAATHRLVEGLFACEPLGEQALRGVARPLGLYRVAGEGRARSRLEAAGPGGLTPLVGREREVGLLLEQWEAAALGAVRAVLLSGEAGIGKSRLVQVLGDRLASAPHTRLDARCSPHHRNSALYPVVELLRRWAGLGDRDPPAERLAKLEHALLPLGTAPSEALPLFAALLAVPLGRRYPPLTLSPERQRQHTLEALVSLLHAVAERQPTLLVVEDLHWADPSTLDWLDVLLGGSGGARDAPLLVLLITRPGLWPPWDGRDGHARLLRVDLPRLGPRAVRALVERVAGGKPLPPEVLREIAGRTDGNPLFVEELTKLVLESGLLALRGGGYALEGPLPPLAIPTTLQDSLMARLDRLGAAKGLAQLAATVGRDFSYRLLRAVSPLEDTRLRAALAGLMEAELVFQQDPPPRATYRFKHALVQEAAYRSLLRPTRRRYHRRIVEVLQQDARDGADVGPELLAHHCTEAALADEAVGYWHEAGRRAVERSAYAEAIAHLRKARELLETLPESPARAERELTLLTALAAPLVGSRAYGHPEVDEIYARAWELCQRRVGEGTQRFTALLGLFTYSLIRAQFGRAHEVGEQMLELARSLGDRGLMVGARFCVGAGLSYVGDHAAARRHLEEGVALDDPARQRSLARLFVFAPGVGCRRALALPLWALGYPDQALRRSREALAMARELNHPYTLVSALAFAATLHHYRREPEAVREAAGAALALSSELGYPHWEWWALILSGWALTELAPRSAEPGTAAARAQREEGLARIQRGIEAISPTGGLHRPYWLALLAEAHARGGQHEEALGLLTEALAVARQTGERSWEAELHRARGTALLALSDGGCGDRHGEAEACFRTALEVARRQGARSLELRAATSLGRLLREQGRREAARSELGDVLGWFTEGADTVDLREAGELSGALR